MSEKWQISSQAPNRGRFNDYCRKASRLKRAEVVGSQKWDEDIVCAPLKDGGYPSDSDTV